MPSASRFTPLNAAGVYGGKRKYLIFCREAGTASLLAMEQKLIEFVAFAVKYQTIKCYMFAVRHLQIASGGGDSRVENMPVLKLVLQDS